MSADPRFRALPAVGELLRHPRLAGRPGAVEALRGVLAEARDSFADPAASAPTAEEIAARVEDALATRRRTDFQSVLNATGIVLHTNLGRSVLATEAVEAVQRAAADYGNLELDLTIGNRSSRQALIAARLAALTGAEAATAVNNCAAALHLVLKSLAFGREVVISRGQLVEIGGGFRIPDILTASGATLREVGTTNITRASDYANAVTPATAMLLRVHTGNFRQRGFTKSVALPELVKLGRERGIPVVDDVGSGMLLDLAPFGLGGEPAVRASVAAGADLVLFSGDKLLGGPQAGLIVGKAALVAKLERDPLFRCLRLDKLTLAALDATLRLYDDPESARRSIPTLRMLTMPLGELRERALAFAVRLGEAAEVADDVAYSGGGALPDVAFPTVVVRLRSRSATALAARLRHGTPPVLSRIHDDRVQLDLRAIPPNSDGDLADAVARALSLPGSPGSP